MLVSLFAAAIICFAVVIYGNDIKTNAGFASRECFRHEAARPGCFICNVQCQSPSCFTYYPNRGNCYLREFTRDQILGGLTSGTCPLQNQSFPATSRWIVASGGSNLWIQIKFMLDELLPNTLPPDVDINPADLYGAPYTTMGGEPGGLDIVWDPSGNVVYKQMFPIAQVDPYAYGIPDYASSVYQNAPSLKDLGPGSFRLSYTNVHWASDLPSRFDTMVSKDSPWLETSVINVAVEWTYGLWKDPDPTVQTQVDVFTYLNARSQVQDKATRMNIDSLVYYDKATDPTIGQPSHMKDVSIAMDDVLTPSFPKYFVSKADIVHDQYELTGRNLVNCGHTKPIVNTIFSQQFFNIICGPVDPIVSGIVSSSSPPVSNAMVQPSCLVIQDPELCLLDIENNDWHSDFLHQCPYSFKNVSRAGFGRPDSCRSCSTPLPECLVQSQSTPLRRYFIISFHVFGIITLVFIVVMAHWTDLPSWMAYAAATFKAGKLFTRKKLSTIAATSISSSSSPSSPTSAKYYEEVVVDPTMEEDSSLSNNSELTSKLRSQIEVGIILKDNYKRSFKGDCIEDGGGTYANVSSCDITQNVSQETQGVDSFQSMEITNKSKPVATSLLPSLSFLYKTNSTLDTEGSAKKNVALMERKNGIEFARYLSSWHIVLGHLYNGNHLAYPLSLYRFGFTWVPWYFMLSGFILTHAELQREMKAAAATPVTTTKESVLDNENAAKEGGLPVAEVTNDAPRNERANVANKTTIPIINFKFIVRRLYTIYPIYFLGILVCIASTWGIKGWEKVPPATDVLLHVTLLQAWVPGVVERGMGVLTHTWFLSCLFFYWCLFDHIFLALQKASDRAILGVFFTCSIVLPLIYVCATINLSPNWMDAHQYFSTSKPVDAEVTFLKFHPFSYIHIFTIGCCLPRINIMLGRSKIGQRVEPFMGTISLVLLLLLFNYPNNNTCIEQGIACDRISKHYFDPNTMSIPGYKLNLRLGIISIVQAAYLLGLTCPSDPIYRVFSAKLPRYLGNFGYTQYVFQFIVYLWFNAATNSNTIDASFVFLLITCSVWVTLAVRAMLSRIKKAPLLLLSTFIIAVAAYLLAEPVTVLSSTAINVQPLRNEIKWIQQAPDWWNDQVIPFDSLVGQNYNMKGEIEGYAPINPSILVDPVDKMTYFTMRLNKVTSKNTKFNGRSLLQHEWDIQTMYGYWNQSIIKDTPTSTYSDPSSPSLSAVAKFCPSAFTPCIQRPECSPNGTVTTIVTNGPQDARLFAFNNSRYMSFFSYEQIDVNGVYDDFGTGTGQCYPSPRDGLIGRMYITKVDSPEYQMWACSTMMPVYVNQLVFPSNSVVKNWLSLVYYNATAKQEQLFWIHRLAPETIILRTLDLTESSTVVNTEVAFTSPIPDKFKALLDDFNAYEVHGSANPVLVSGGSGTRTEDYYFGLLHLVSDTNTTANYATFALALRSEPPFDIIALSPKLWMRSLPTTVNYALCSSPSIFASGLMLRADPSSNDMYVHMTYGVCDLESRIVSVPLSQLEALMW